MVNEKILKYSILGGAAIGGAYLLSKIISGQNQNILPPPPPPGQSDAVTKIKDENAPTAEDIEKYPPSTGKESISEPSGIMIRYKDALLNGITNDMKNMKSNDFYIKLFSIRQHIQNKSISAGFEIGDYNKYVYTSRGDKILNLKTDLISINNDVSTTYKYNYRIKYIYIISYFKNNEGKIAIKIINRFNGIDNSIITYANTWVDSILREKNIFVLSVDSKIDMISDNINDIKIKLKNYLKSNKLHFYKVFKYIWKNKKYEKEIILSTVKIQNKVEPSTYLEKSNPFVDLFPNFVLDKQYIEIRDYSMKGTGLLYMVIKKLNSDLSDEQVKKEVDKLFTTKCKTHLKAVLVLQNTKGFHRDKRVIYDIKPTTEPSQLPYRYIILKLNEKIKFDKNKKQYISLNEAKKYISAGHGIYKVLFKRCNHEFYAIIKTPVYIRDYNYNLTIYKFKNKNDMTFKDVYSNNIEWKDAHIQSLQDAKNKVKQYQKQTPDYAYMIYGDPKYNPKEIHLIYSPLNSSLKGALTKDSFGNICRESYKLKLKHKNSSNWIWYDVHNKTEVEIKSLFKKLLLQNPQSKIIVSGQTEDCKKLYFDSDEYKKQNPYFDCKKYYGLKSSDGGFKIGRQKLSDALWQLKYYSPPKTNIKVQLYVYLKSCNDSSKDGKIIKEYGFYKLNNNKWYNETLIGTEFEKYKEIKINQSASSYKKYLLMYKKNKSGHWQYIDISTPNQLKQQLHLYSNIIKTFNINEYSKDGKNKYLIGKYIQNNGKYIFNPKYKMSDAPYGIKELKI